MGTILGKYSNGKFTAGGSRAIVPENSHGHHEANLAFQRKEFAADLVQPDDGTGHLNPDYVSLYYDKAVEHGLIARPNPDETPDAHFDRSL